MNYYWAYQKDLYAFRIKTYRIDKNSTYELLKYFYLAILLA